MSVITFGRDDHTKLTENFERYEFQCPCGCGSQMVDTELASKLQTIRDKLGKKIKITSGYRCIHAALKSLSSDAQKYLNDTYGDTTGYLETRIEAQINANKRAAAKKDSVQNTVNLG